MRNVGLLLMVCSLLFAAGGCRPADKQRPAPANASRTVAIRQTADGYQLLRHGKPYFIRGVGGYSRYERLKACGGNSIRVWETADAERILDQAHRLGLTVNLGLWINGENSGFDYNDQSAVREQFDRLEKIVRKYKDHPALLMWCVGNEWTGATTNVKTWDAVNEVAEMIHRIDPNHPTTTALFVTNPRPMNILAKRCPAIDILSINAYGSLPTVIRHMANSDWKGPYLISEYGARGYWETEETRWKAPVEQTSTQKAAFTADRYQEYVASHDGKLLGAYAFLWGQKQERTPTWFSFFDEQGRETELVETMQYLWTGNYPVNRAPRVANMAFTNPGDQYTFPVSDSLYTAYIQVTDPDGDSLHYHWEILPEVEKQGNGNIFIERKPDPLPGLLTDTVGSQIQFRMPRQPGAYRLFTYAYDSHHHVATANVSFYVQETEAPVSLLR